MPFRYFIIFILFIFSTAALADCKINKHVLGAVYDVKKSTDGKKYKLQRRVILWRNGQQVAHEYKDTHITELWEKTKLGKLRLERHFDKHKRGIEYHPSEINNGEGTSNWHIRNQLISNKLLREMQLTSTTGENCQVLEKYTLSNDVVQIKLDWLPVLALVKSYMEESSTGKLEWKLERIIHDEKQVKRAFQTRSEYLMTDYTDIGDNETDPFLTKMINLGYIEHSHSSIYNDKGETFGGDNHHAHNH